jgi:outer membrane receptor protein involved in Fe transport
MTIHIRPSKNGFNFTLKPIQLIICSLFAQHAYGESLTLAQLDAQSKQLKQCEESASGSRAKAQCKTNAQLQAQIAADDAYDQAIAVKEQATQARSQAQHAQEEKVQLAQASLEVEDVLLGEEPNTNPPANANRIHVDQDIIKTAEVTDASPVGAGGAVSEKPNSNNKINTPNKSINSKTLNKKEGKDLPIDVQLNEVKVRAKRFHEIGPLPGLGLTKEEIPGNVQSISAKEIKESHALSLSDLMNSKLQSVSVNDYQGNPFQMDVNYRGFTASPQIGTAQGISVFLDGIRVNEPFGDVVNWDMIPMNALSSLDVFPGSNPLFGLGTLGGALSMRTKSGFLDEGVDAEILAGSYGRKQLQISAGGNNEVIAGFLSGNFFLEDGWRDNSPSKVNQVFGKAEWRNDQVQLGLSMLYAGNKLTGNGLLPEQMADQNRSQVYTSPDTSKNDLLQFQLSGIWDVSETFNVTGQVYHRNSKRKSKTTDVNEDFAGYATPADKGAGQQILAGFSDINNDGLPDFNDFAANVAADAAGNPLDNNGNICIDPNDPCVNNLAIGTDFADNSGLSAAVQAAQGNIAPATDGNGVPVVPGTILSWALDPRVSANSLQFDFENPSTLPNVFNSGATSGTNLPAAYYQFALQQWKNKVFQSQGSTNVASFGGLHPGGAYNTPGDPRSNVFFPDLFNRILQANYTDSNGFYHGLTILNSVNRDPLGNPVPGANPNPGTTIVSLPGSLGFGLAYVLLDSNGAPIQRDGATIGQNGELGTGTGYIDGTPTALITETEIDQVGTGGSLQLNWNLDQHKFMVGGSVDMADAKYASSEYLGILDGKRNGRAAPELLGYEYYARDAAHAVSLNDFKGDSITSSLYTSETWAPTKNLNITAAARYNYTTINNELAVTNAGRFNRNANSFFNLLDVFTLCTGAANPATGLVDGVLCPTGIESGIVPFTPVTAQGLGILQAGEKEKFHYHSFNPSLGATWQANEALNVYSNWNRGARTPSVIELGCAFDDTLIALEGTNPVIYQERSLADRRSCNLPGTLSGDPYLKQVRSETFELGARGNWSNDLEWNASVYRTDLQDDIYFVSVSANRSFFQNIGDTRRQGLEMGLKGKLGKARFGLNYSLTDASFQSAFRLDSPHNSSAGANSLDETAAIENGLLVRRSNFGKINVKPGDRLPGIPLHNLNANFSYDITDKWTIGLNAVMHSSAFVRGNENNKHKAGPATPLHTNCIDPTTLTQFECDVPRADFREGKTPGYTVFNLQSSYKLATEWTLGMQVNNLFDKEYASAGRLGLNAFSPSINGAIGASGFNYNSNDWQGTSFLGLGAPRSAYFTLTYQFDAKKQ